MKTKLNDYKARLEKGIVEYMANPVSERSSNAIDGMIECWKHITEMEKMLEGCKEASDIDYAKWNQELENEDGSMGGHWTIDQTNAVARSLGYNHDERDFNVTMNMMYSDYYKVAERFGVSVPEFYATMANAFLNDSDARKDKLKMYYNYIRL